MIYCFFLSSSVEFIIVNIRLNITGFLLVVAKHIYQTNDNLIILDSTVV